MKDQFDPGTIDLEAWLTKDRMKEEFQRSLRQVENGDDAHTEDEKPSSKE